MPKFEKKYVHFMWSDELEGKKCFIADRMGELKIRVEQQDEQYIHTVIGENSDNYPFYTNKNGFYAFAYYDPYYELKVAHEQGKTIQYLVGEKWDDSHEPIWKYEPERYRIKPEEENPVTNRELARWLVQGNGEFYHHDDAGFRTEVKTSYSYHQDEDNYDCNINSNLHCKIRKWGDTEWVTPTREYMGLEE